MMKLREDSVREQEPCECTTQQYGCFTASRGFMRKVAHLTHDVRCRRRSSWPACLSSFFFWMSRAHFISPSRQEPLKQRPFREGISLGPLLPQAERHGRRTFRKRVSVRCPRAYRPGWFVDQRATALAAWSSRSSERGSSRSEPLAVTGVRLFASEKLLK